VMQKKERLSVSLDLIVQVDSVYISDRQNDFLLSRGSCRRLVSRKIVTS